MNFKFYAIIFAFILLGTSSHAQLVSNGATIKIQSGAMVFVAGDVQNNSGSTLSNDGKLEVQGNFTNNAVYSSTTADDSLILSGAGNVTLNGGTSTLNYLTLNKTVNTNTITLTGTTFLGQKLDYLSGSFTTDAIAHPLYLFSAPAAAVFNFAAGREIAGKVRRTAWTSGTARIFNQANMQVTTNGGTAPTDFTVTMLPQAAGGDPTQAEREVKRKFQFEQTGGTGFTSDIRFAYADAELNTNAESTLIPWQLVSAEWNGKLTPVTRDGSTNYVATTGILAADLANEWKLADARYTFNATAFLRGPWNNVSAMNTNSNGILPLTQPYNVTPFNYSGTENVSTIPNTNIVDWILVELRKPATGLPEDAISSTIIGAKAGFLLNNGAVVDIDGVTPISFDISKQGSSFVVVRHRNHLGVISNAIPSSASGIFTNDFSILTNNYKPAGSPSDPVVLLTGAGGKYGLWAGDANKNGAVNASDINLTKQSIAATASGYLLTDINLNTGVNSADLNIIKTTIGATGNGSGAKGSHTAQKVIITNIPDPIIEN